MMLVEHNNQCRQVVRGGGGAGTDRGVWPAGDLQWGEAARAAHAELPVTRRDAQKHARSVLCLLYSC